MSQEEEDKEIIERRGGQGDEEIAGGCEGGDGNEEPEAVHGEPEHHGGEREAETESSVSPSREQGPALSAPEQGHSPNQLKPDSQNLNTTQKSNESTATVLKRSTFMNSKLK